MFFTSDAKSNGKYLLILLFSGLDGSETLFIALLAFRAAGIQCIDPTGGSLKRELCPNGYNAFCVADVGRSRVTRLTGSPLLLGSRKEGYKRFSNTAPSHRTNIDANVTLREI